MNNVHVGRAIELAQSLFATLKQIHSRLRDHMRDATTMGSKIGFRRLGEAGLDYVIFQISPALELLELIHKVCGNS